MKVMVLLVLTCVAGCFRTQPETAPAAIAECQLRFRAAHTTKDSVTVLDDRPWCRETLVRPQSRRP